MRRTVAVLLIAPVLCGCAPPESPAPAGTEDYAVYSAVLDRLYSDASALPVADHTGLMLGERRHYGEQGRAISGSSRRLVRSFVSRNRSGVELDPAGFTTRVPVLLLELDSVAVSGPGLASWERFYARYPGTPGLLRLSGVGFTRDTTRALLSVERVCGFLCGAGEMVLLERIDGRWTVIGRMESWIS